MATEEGHGQLVSRDKVPTILMFQPTEFELVDNEGLKAFEESLINDVGLKNFELKAHGGGTTCRCPRKDDCDFATLDF